MTAMLKQPRFRRSCFIFVCRALPVVTMVLYVGQNSLIVRDSVTRDQLKPIKPLRITTGGSSSLAAITITTNNSNIGDLSIAARSYRLAEWYKAVLQTTESVAESSTVLASGSQNASEDSHKQETGDEGAELTYKQGEVERSVRREVTRYRIRPPKSVHCARGNWQVLEADRDVYVYSSFYDSRPNLDSPHVRVIAVAEYDVHTYKLCCLLWYPSQCLPDVAEVSVVEVGGKYVLEGRPGIGPYILSCRTNSSKTDPPDRVSLVSPYNLRRISNLLPVHVPQPTKKVIEFGVCMKTLYGRQNALRLVEWLETHRMWGVDEVNIYASAIDNITETVLRRYSQTGFVRYRESPVPFREDSLNAVRVTMPAVINDCMYRNVYRYRNVICTDLDEMIVPGSPHQNYSEMLTAADAAATRVNAVVHSYAFRNAYFFLDFEPTENGPFYLLTQRFEHGCVS